MKVMVIVKATEHFESGTAPDPKVLEVMHKFNAELSTAGILVAAEGLLPTSKGARVRLSGTNRNVTQGPFANPNDQIAGYWIWQVKSVDEAIEWVKRCPNPMPVDCDIEIRPMLDQDEPAAAPQVDTREPESVAKAEAMGLGTPRFGNGKELTIAGLKQRYMFASRNNIPTHWQRFAVYLGRIPNQIGKVTYGICSNHSTEGGFDYLSGVEVSLSDDLPSEFSTLTIASHRYAVFTHTDHVSTIPHTIDTICKKWLLESGFKPSSNPCFERYTEQFDPKTGTGGVEIWVPIEK